MKKLALLLLLSFFSSQVLAKVYYCEWQNLIKINQINSTYGEDVNTKFIDEYDSKFTFLKEENQIILGASQDGFFHSYTKIPLNLGYYGNNDYVDDYFSGAKSSITSTEIFMTVKEQFEPTSTSNFYFNRVFHDTSSGRRGYSISGMAECTN